MSTEIHKPSITERLLGFPVSGFLASAKSVLHGKNRPMYTQSDLISKAGLALIFPEIEQNPDISRVIGLLISLGTAVDNLADEGPDHYSNNLQLTNKDHYDQLRDALLKESMVRNTPELIDLVGQFLQKVWTIEQWGHSEVFHLESEQKTYRELINAIWSVMYHDIVNLLLQTSTITPERVETKPVESIPSSTELLQNPKFEISHLQSEFIWLTSLNTESGTYNRKLFILYLLVMETSNWYDTELNVGSNTHTTPRIRQRTDEYVRKLALLGVPKHIVFAIFFAAKQVMRITGVKSKLKSLFLQQVSYT